MRLPPIVSVAAVFCLFCAPSVSATATEFRLVGCAAATILDFSVAANWSPVGVPGALDTAIIDNSTCVVALSSSISLYSLQVANRSHLMLDAGTKLTIEDSLIISFKAALSMKGLNSEIHVGNVLNVTDGVLSGSGSIFGTMHCGALCELDVLTYLADTMDFVGNLTIYGDLFMYQGQAIRSFLFGGLAAPLNHSVIALGATGVLEGGLLSNFTVTGKMYIERMSLSVLIYPNASSATAAASYMVNAIGGIVYLDIAGETTPTSSSRITIVTPIVSLPESYGLPPYRAGIHVGRKLPLGMQDTGYSALQDGTGCTSGDTVTIGVVFGSGCLSTNPTPTTPVCGLGFVWSDIASMCVENCADPTCSGHGTCQIGLGTYCDCTTGWTGLQCQLPDCAKVNGVVCNMKGTCEAPVSAGQMGTCNCQADWNSQPDCSVYNGTGSSQVSCGSGNSTVQCGPVVSACTVDGQCACPTNWTGTTCETPVCPNDCSGHGTCKADRVEPYCECTSPASGADCSSNINANNNNGAGVGALPTNTVIGIAVGASIGFVILVAVVVILIVKFSSSAKNAVRPFAHRQTATTAHDDL